MAEHRLADRVALDRGRLAVWFLAALLLNLGVAAFSLERAFDAEPPSESGRPHNHPSEAHSSYGSFDASDGHTSGTVSFDCTDCVELTPPAGVDNPTTMAIGFDALTVPVPHLGDEVFRVTTQEPDHHASERAHASPAMTRDDDGHPLQGLEPELAIFAVRSDDPATVPDASIPFEEPIIAFHHLPFTVQTEDDEEGIFLLEETTRIYAVDRSIASAARAELHQKSALPIWFSPERTDRVVTVERPLHATDLALGADLWGERLGVGWSLTVERGHADPSRSHDHHLTTLVYRVERTFSDGGVDVAVEGVDLWGNLGFWRLHMHPDSPYPVSVSHAWQRTADGTHRILPTFAGNLLQALAERGDDPVPIPAHPYRPVPPAARDGDEPPKPHGLPMGSPAGGEHGAASWNHFEGLNGGLPPGAWTQSTLYPLGTAIRDIRDLSSSFVLWQHAHPDAVLVEALLEPHAVSDELGLEGVGTLSWLLTYAEGSTHATWRAARALVLDSIGALPHSVEEVEWDWQHADGADHSRSALHHVDFYDGSALLAILDHHGRTTPPIAAAYRLEVTAEGTVTASLRLANEHPDWARWCSFCAAREPKLAGVMDLRTGQVLRLSYSDA